eukprot:COSAG02_NODE_1601_length_11741_cov_40.329411_8_plen_85_part_00
MSEIGQYELSSYSGKCLPIQIQIFLARKVSNRSGACQVLSLDVIHTQPDSQTVQYREEDSGGGRRDSRAPERPGMGRVVRGSQG